MPRSKNYGPKPGLAEVADAVPGATVRDAGMQHAAVPTGSADVDVMEIVGHGRRNPDGIRTIALSEWLGRGIDAWVWASKDALVAALHARQHELNTLNGYAGGFRQVFRFLTEGRCVPLLTDPAGMTAAHVRQFVAWLRMRAAARQSRGDGVRTEYTRAKGALRLLLRQYAIKVEERDFFPTNPFAGLSKTSAAQQPLSDAEQQRLAQSLKADLSALHHGRIHLTGADVATLHYLVVALRTGGNPTPLLEMCRDPLRPGLLPGTMILETRKYRAHKTVRKALRGPQSDTDDPGNNARVIPMDAVAVLQRMIAITEPLIAAAPVPYRNLVWLYSSQAQRSRGGITCLNKCALHRSIARLVERHGLLGDDGKPLKLNTMRLRQSLAQRGWRLTEGDPFGVAALLGNTPRVAGTNYSSITEKIKAEAARLLGAGLASLLAASSSGKTIIPIATVTTQDLTPTPTARCKDSLYGENAPKDGMNHCRSFLLCLFCKSFAVVGEPDDLWRLFSFQAFLESELARMRTLRGEGLVDVAEMQSLCDILLQAITFIDDFTTLHFGPKLPREAKARAKVQLHPFWALELRKARSFRGHASSVVS